MIAEDLNSDQIIDILDNRIVIWSTWLYKNLADGAYRLPGNVVTGAGDVSPCGLIVTPNESSTIIIHSLTTDDDSGGLNNTDTITFRIYYATTTNPDSPLKQPMFKIKLSDRYHVSTDTKGKKYIFPINRSYKLSNIPNYRKIRAFSITLTPQKGYTKSGECNIAVCYKQDY